MAQAHIITEKIAPPQPVPVSHRISKKVAKAGMSDMNQAALSAGR